MARLFDEDFVKRVAALRWIDARRGTQAGFGAPHGAPGTQGFDLAGHRPYGQGDDLRALDWNALARLGQPVIRRFKDAEPRELWFVIDRSPSMQFGEPTKDTMARRLAGALGIVAMASGAATGILGEGLTARSPAAWLTRIERLPKTKTLLTPGETEGSRSARPREWIVLCDPYDLAAVHKLLTVLRHNRDTVLLVLITSADDRQPPSQDTIVVDSESAERRSFSAASASEFASRRDALLAAWRSLSAQHRASLTEVDSAQSWESAAISLLQARAAAHSS